MPMRVSHSVLSAPICVPNSGSCIFPVSLNALNAPVSTNLHPDLEASYNVSHTQTALITAQAMVAVPWPPPKALSLQHCIQV